MLMRHLTVFCIVVFCFTGLSEAQVFFSDGFDYPDGQLTDSEAGAGDNVSGGLWTGHSGTTFGDNVDVIAGNAQVLNSGSEDVNRLTGVDMAATDTWYIGALFSVNDMRADPTTEAINNDYFLHFKDGAFGFRGRVYLDDPNDAMNDYTLGLSATSGGQTQKWTSDLNFGEQYIVMVSYDFDSGASRLWVNPVDISSMSLLEDTTVDAGTVINSLALRQDFITGPTPNNEILVESRCHW